MSEEIQVREEIQPYTGESWEVMQAQAHEIQGADLVKGDVLIGIPHMAVQVTLRKGDYPHGSFKDGKVIPGTGCGKYHPYMYIRTVVAPDEAIQRAVKRGKILEEQASWVVPGESIGYVEAGTGLYRQMMHYLEGQKYVKLPEGPADGPFGESRFDSLAQTWDFLRGSVMFDPDGQPVWTADIRLYFPRGLRVSEYENEYTKQGRTRYAG